LVDYHRIKQPIGAVFQLALFVQAAGIGIIVVRDQRSDLPGEAISQHGSQEAGQGLSLGGLAEGVQAVGHELTFQLIEVLLQLIGIIVEFGLIGGDIQQVRLKVLVQVHLSADIYYLILVALLDAGVFHTLVLEDSLRQIGQVAVEAGGHYGRGQMGDHHCIAPPLGLGALGDVVHDIGIDHRQILDQKSRPVVPGDAALLSRQPLLGAVLCQMDYGVGSKSVFEPEIEGDVLVMGRHGFIVIEHCAVLQPAPARLGQEDDISKGELGNH